MSDNLFRFDQVLSKLMEGKKRLSGEPEINHPRRITNEMIEDGLHDRALLPSALGHDSVEDGYLTLEEIEHLFIKGKRELDEIEKEYGKDLRNWVEGESKKLGKEIRALIDGETKLSKELEKERREKESLIKHIDYAARLLDTRVIFLKAYDNLDNWRDQHVFLCIPGKENAPREHAEETLRIYAAFMNAFNFWKMRVRLEDLALPYFDPDYVKDLEIYNEAVSHSGNEIQKIAEKIQQELDLAGIPAAVTYRTKYYSEIYRKCREKGIPMKSLFKSSPLYAHYISVVVDDNPDFSVDEFKGSFSIKELCQAIKEDAYGITLKAPVNTIKKLIELLSV
ncbi:MAG: hypothetical protein V3T21_02845, partial [Candidatus Margulisiibacteriota bacterium]